MALNYVCELVRDRYELREQTKCELGGNGSVRKIQPKCRIKQFEVMGAKSPR